MTKLVDELLVFSDHHAHPFTYGAKEVMYDGVLTNSRLLASVDVLKQLHKYADDHDIKTVVFGGDLFHTREAVSTDAYNLTMQVLRPFLRDRRSFLLVGNHDCHDRDGFVHSLEGFKNWYDPNIRVVDARVGLPVYGDRYLLCFVPYTEDRVKAINLIKTLADWDFGGPKLLFAHLGMQGATVGSDYVLVNENDLGVDDIPTKAFTGCLFGHYHQHPTI